MSVLDLALAGAKALADAFSPDPPEHHVRSFVAIRTVSPVVDWLHVYETENEWGQVETLLAEVDLRRA